MSAELQMGGGATEALIGRLAAEGAAPRRPGPGRALGLALPAAWGVAALLVLSALGVRGDLAAYPGTPAGALKFAGGAALALAGAVLAAGLARPEGPGRGARAALALALAGVATGAAGLLAAAEALAPLGAAAREAVKCGWPILPLAAPALGAGLLALRRAGASTRPAAAGAAAGLAAGAVGALAYALWCPADDVGVVAIGYGGALALAAGAGAGLGRRALVW